MEIENKKLLTVVVPCYNSEDYMDRCLASLLVGGDAVEIILIDDGSDKDRTPQIADQYAQDYPDIIRVIHQENKGHGGAINTGIDHATGLFFKVCDSDDWFDADAYHKVLRALRHIDEKQYNVDVVFNNYVYEKVNSDRKNFIMSYQRFMPQDVPFTWEDMKRIDSLHYILMHSLIYRTDFLRETGLRLPEHTFYEDNIYAFVPFFKVKTMYYCCANLYRYYIGRADQSVNENVMRKRLPQQQAINELMFDYLEKGKNLPMCRQQRNFLIHDVTIITTITSVIMIRDGSKEMIAEKDKLWQRLKKADRRAYYQIRMSVFGFFMHLPNGGRHIVDKGYRLVQHFYGLT